MCLLLLVLMSQCDISCSINSLISSPRTADHNGVVSVCPNMQLSFTCTINGYGSNFTTWRSTSPDCNAPNSHSPPAIVNCATGQDVILSITFLSDYRMSTDRSSVALLNSPTNGQIVSCFDGTVATSAKRVGQISICVIGE